MGLLSGCSDPSPKTQNIPPPAPDSLIERNEFIPASARPSFLSKLPIFEDFVLFSSDPAPRLIYRLEGNPDGVIRRPLPEAAGGLIEFVPLPSNLIHPALYEEATLNIQVLIKTGEPQILIAHNGFQTNTGETHSNTGIALVLGTKSTQLIDLSNKLLLGEISEVFPRDVFSEIQIAWSFYNRSIRIDMPKNSYVSKLPEHITKRGGFGIRNSTEGLGHFRVKRLQVFHEDTRSLALYDGFVGLFDFEGQRILTWPEVSLPSGSTRYATSAIDLRRNRSLVYFGSNDLNIEHPETIRGFGVRELSTGELKVLDSRILKTCLPVFGGGGTDGRWMMFSWTVPSSICWLNWNAYEKGNLEDFFVPSYEAEGPLSYHDASNSLDGSLARYIRFNSNSKIGVTALTVHPELKAFVSSDLAQEVTIPEEAYFEDNYIRYAERGFRAQFYSQTGPGGFGSILAVRDVDRLIFELWDYSGPLAHNQNLGFNLFNEKVDWIGTFHSTTSGASSFVDIINLVPSLKERGKSFGQVYTFAPPNSPGTSTCANTSTAGAIWMPCWMKSQWAEPYYSPSTGETNYQYSNAPSPLPMRAFQVLVDLDRR